MVSLCCPAHFSGDTVFYSVYICLGLIQTVVFYLEVVVLCFTVRVLGFFLGSFPPEDLLVWGTSVNLVRGCLIAPWFLARSCLGGGGV